MRYRIRHTTKYAYDDPVAVCHNLVRLAPRTSARQTVNSYRLVVSPDAMLIGERTDLFGNRVQYFSIDESHHGLSLTAISEVGVEPSSEPQAKSLTWESVRAQIHSAAAPLPLAACRFAYASPHVPLNDKVREYAAPSFTPGRSILEAAKDFTARLHNDFDYDPRATTVSTPISVALEQRAGVCQDFAHVQIAGLRAMGLAARYVSGYLRTLPPPGKERLVGADASHAWLSVYVGDGAWVDLDPTNNCVPGTDHVTVAIGRDYGDVCPIQGVFVGGGSHTMSVSVDVAPLTAKPTTTP
ncbi:transglutaminase family protein [Botrimarina hoheduenensis]|uniref:Protein-glutamine gamma-glutamyltransferase n=1 Tax=Botrimarina hoheduenensis TaxID=2528000 RepID=A0A5C5VT55_9BACT|nr:transglutaminase family protein [Botrimarina hoheduenensis]TWT40799.1 Protein-glutamine gamma-glutamyltransferase [Botrimarina hoheduenensis]